MSFWPKANTKTTVGSVLDTIEPIKPALMVHPSGQEPAPVAPAAGAAPAVVPPEISAEARQTGIAASKAMMAVFGEIMTVLMRAPHYRALPLSELEWLVGPAVGSRQFALAEAQSKTNGLVTPVGAVLWASVSDEIDRRFSEDLAAPLRLQPNEWRSGDHLWVIEAVGEPQTVQGLLGNLAGSLGKDRRIKMRARDKDGTVRVALLPAPA